MIDEMTTTVPQRDAAESGEAPVRVSLREVRECSFRALSAAGASHGEAWAAARMVVDAELQGHQGIEVLIADLERGRWPRVGVDLAEPGGAEMAVTRLGTAASTRVLRHAPLAVALAVAELDSGVVFVPGELPGMAVLDAVLLEVAAARGCSVGVLRSGSSDGAAFRVALPDGSLGSGSLPDRATNDAVRDDIRVDAVQDSDEDGLWVLAPTPQGLQGSPGTTWVSAQERSDRRASAARDGCLVDAASWSRLYAASRHYLVD